MTTTDRIGPISSNDNGDASCGNIAVPKTMAATAQVCIDQRSDWNPSRRPPRHEATPIPHRLRYPAHLDGARNPGTWTLIGIRVADNLGAVRTGMTYNKDYTTRATFFEKSRRTQFLEGPNEIAIADHLEMNPRYLDFQFQPLDITFRRGDGKIIHKYPDVGIEYDDNSVRFGEIKTDEHWFGAAAVRGPLDKMNTALATHGIEPLLEIKGKAYRNERAIQAHNLAMDARLTIFDPGAEVETVRKMIRAAGGCAPYGALVTALGGQRAFATDKLYAMLLRRVVNFDLSAIPTHTTQVTLPRPARAFALRDLLRKFERRVA